MSYILLDGCTVDGSEIQLMLVVYPIIYKGFIHPFGGDPSPDFWTINGRTFGCYPVPLCSQARVLELWQRVVLARRKECGGLVISGVTPADPA